MSFFKRIVYTYHCWLSLYPFRMQAVQVGVILGLGDIVAQKIVVKQDWDYDRTLRFMSTGVFLGPSIHAWFIVLEKLFGKSKKAALYKMVTDQFVFAPTMLAAMLTYVNFVNGAGTEQLKKVLSEDYPKLLLDNYKVWPAAQFINFYFIPLQFRVVFLQTLGVLWNAYISWQIQLSKEAAKKVNYKVKYWMKKND